MVFVEESFVNERRNSINRSIRRGSISAYNGNLTLMTDFSSLRADQDVPKGHGPTCDHFQVEIVTNFTKQMLDLHPQIVMLNEMVLRNEMILVFTRIKPFPSSNTSILGGFLRESPLELVRPLLSSLLRFLDRSPRQSRGSCPETCLQNCETIPKPSLTCLVHVACRPTLNIRNRLTSNPFPLSVSQIINRTIRRT